MIARYMRGMQRANGIERGRGLSAVMDRRLKKLYAFVWRETDRAQIRLTAISLVVAGLAVAPLELQRHIVNEATLGKNLTHLLLMCAGYGGVVLIQGATKYVMRMWRGRIAADVMYRLRTNVAQGVRGRDAPEFAKATNGSRGKSMAIIAAEVTPVGGFVGDSISVPLSEGGILVVIFGYMVVIEPLIAVAAIAVFIPQMVVVPRVQDRINERVRRHTEEMRELGNELDEEDAGSSDFARTRLRRISAIQIQAFRLKFALKFLLNLLNHAATLAVLAVGSWMVLRGRTEIGTVVAFLTGIERVSDPWRELVTFYRQASNALMRSRLIDDAMAELSSPFRILS